MKLSFRLQEILNQLKEGGRGSIQKLADKTGLERHQIAAVLHNDAQYVSLETLGRICSYLVEHRGLDPQVLPGLLFSRGPEDFWGLLAERHSLTLCVGIRREGEDAWVTVSDAYLQGILLHGISVPEGVTRRPILEQKLVTAPDTEGNLIDRAGAEDIYRLFDQLPGNCALVALGSIKINSIVELIISQAFRAQPFQEEQVARPCQRSCPFQFIYRPSDPRVPSCCGDVRLSRGRASQRPGLYYEEKDGSWTCCPCDDTHDAALVFYRFQPPQERVEMILGGFSGRATRCLADVLATQPAKLWPPSFESPQHNLAAFIVKFRFPAASASRSNPSHQIIPLAREVFQRRQLR